MLELLKETKFDKKSDPNLVSPNMLKPKPDDKFGINLKQSKDWLLATPQLYGTDYSRIMFQGKVDTRKSNKKLAQLAGKVVDGVGLGKVNIGGSSLNKLVTQVHPEFPSDLLDNPDTPKKTRTNLYSELYNGNVDNSKTAVGSFLQTFRTPNQIKEAALPSLAAGATSFVLDKITTFAVDKIGVGKNQVPNVKPIAKGKIVFPSDLIEKDNRFAARNQAQLLRTKDFENLYDEQNKLEGIYLGNVDTKSDVKFKNLYAKHLSEYGQGAAVSVLITDVKDDGSVTYESKLKFNTTSRFLNSDGNKINAEQLTYGLNQVVGSTDLKKSNLIKITKESKGYTIKMKKSYTTFYDDVEYYSKSNANPQDDIASNIFGPPADGGFGLYRPLSKTNLYNVTGDAPKTFQLTTKSDVTYEQKYGPGDSNYEKQYEDTKDIPDNGGLSFKLGSSDENYIQLGDEDITLNVDGKTTKIAKVKYTPDFDYGDAARKGGFRQNRSTNTNLNLPSGLTDDLNDPIAKKYTNTGVGRYVDNKQIAKREKRVWGNKNQSAAYSVMRAQKADVLINNSPDYFLVQIGEYNFLATITGFSDKVSSNWDSVKPVGSGLNFYLFNNWERGISFDMTLYSEDMEETVAIWEKANQLNKFTMGIPSGTGASYGVYGQLTTLKIGNLINETGFFNSINVSVDDTSPWEVEAGNQLPFICKISVDFQVVTNIEGRDYQFYNKKTEAPPKTGKIDAPPPPKKDDTKVLPTLKMPDVKMFTDTTRYNPVGTNKSDYENVAKNLIGKKIG